MLTAGMEDGGALCTREAQGAERMIDDNVLCRSLLPACADALPVQRGGALSLCGRSFPLSPARFAALPVLASASLCVLRALRPAQAVTGVYLHVTVCDLLVPSVVLTHVGWSASDKHS